MDMIRVATLYCNSFDDFLNITLCLGCIKSLHFWWLLVLFHLRYSSTFWQFSFIIAVLTSSPSVMIYLVGLFIGIFNSS